MLEDERRIRPGTTGTDPLQWKKTECLECTGLACFNEQGNQIPDFHPALLHELYSDGAFFTTAMFHGETSSPPAIRNFQLVQTLHPDAFDAVCGACAKASGNTDFSSPNTGDNFSALGLNLNDSGISGEAANTNISRCGGGRNTPERSVSGIPDTHIIPFLAAAGQVPYSPLGVQLKSFSLRHSPVPGMNYRDASISGYRRFRLRRGAYAAGKHQD